MASGNLQESNRDDRILDDLGGPEQGRIEQRAAEHVDQNDDA